MSVSDTLKRLYSEVAGMILIAGNAGIYAVGEDPLTARYGRYASGLILSR
jgi:hypothetical protein